ncbi:retrovirus-related Pol polyprotein from type-1 retrotransposable element R2 [Nephila pilipes]|uniref:Retrovirus-related Pol polyprotein from type-1 retrotransposable element R2 n=1 Tax=Nephila pilipes TaxID=299642 RepID=A0A8X6T9J5_NEPPI|nr:retrovirus-related Pol polyprotein from type-1 retrotransposable element R2 [Nephila pilipes]
MPDSVDSHSTKTVNELSSTSSSCSITPVAHRTRAGLSTISFIDAARAGQCKMCPIKCTSTIRLQRHILSHKANRKRQKALDAVLSILKSKKAMYTPLSSRMNKPCSLEKKYKDIFPEEVQAKSQDSMEASQLAEKESSSPNIGIVMNDILDLVQAEIPCLAAQDSSSKSSPPMFASLPGLSSTPLGNIALEGSMLDKAISPNLSLPLILEPLPPREIQSEVSLQPTTVDFVTSKCQSEEIVEGLPRLISPIHSPCQEKSPSILEIIMSQEFYSREASPEVDSLKTDHSPLAASRLTTETPSSPMTSPPVSTNKCHGENAKSGPVVQTYLEAARTGLCRICNQSVPPTLLLTHLNTHRPCTKRYKCIRAVVLANKEVKIQGQKLDHLNSGTPLNKSPSDIEKKFREKFPDLPVFQKKTDMSSPDYSDRESPLSELDSPPTGPPSKPAFTKRSYSSVVRKGLYRCQYCELPFVTKNGMDAHLQKVHYISPHPPVQAKLFPPPERPTCRTCHHEIEDGMTIADHCKLHHNLEVSTDRTSPVSKVVEIPDSIQVEPSSRKVSKVSKGKIQVSIGNVPPKTHEESLGKINAKPSKSGAKGTLANNSRSTTPTRGPQNIPRRDNRSDSSLEDFESSTTRKPITSPPGSPTKCPHCPLLAMKKGGLRLHMFRNHHTVVAHREMTAWGSKTTRDPSSSSATPAEQVHQCNRCATICKTAKGLRVHKQSAHNISVRKEGKPGRKATSPQQQSTNSDREVAAPPMEELMREISDEPKDGSVTLQGNVLKYSFPLLDTIRCPERKCNKIFHTRKWYTTNNSVKRHLSIYHRIQLAGVEYWCTSCKRRISGKPASHPCITNAMTSSQGPNSGKNNNSWVCSDCGFKASSRVGLDVHKRVHKKEQVSYKGTPLVSLPNPKQRKQAKNRKIAPLLVGSPGDLPLDHPLPIFQDPSDIIEEDMLDLSNEATLIDIQHPSIIESFLEPLETLMSEDIYDRLRLLEVINNDITFAIQQHFHLEKREASSANPRVSVNEKREKLKDPQTIQKAYAWNRRKCIRDLVESNDTRCSVPTEVIHSHFTATWAAPSADSSPSFPPPPELPTIVESFTENLVCECLKAAENTAPGPDLIAYKHWREADPKGRILTRLFNICLSLKKVPASWKQSDTVLIHKKGDQ